MRYQEITVKGIPNYVPGEDEWFELKYNLNLYRGCGHQCIYCDTRSKCYQIEDFTEEGLIKINTLELLEDALPRKQRIGLIGFGSMNDPYTTAEKRYHLTRQALEIAAKYRFPVDIITKSDLVLRDLEVLKAINQVKARVSFTLTTMFDASEGKRHNPKGGEEAAEHSAEDFDDAFKQSGVSCWRVNHRNDQAENV